MNIIEHLRLCGTINCGYEIADMFNLKQLGNGFYSLVVEHPSEPDKVIKLCSDPEDAWVMYGKLCQTHHTKHMPVVTDLHIFPDGTYFAVMDRLKELPDVYGCAYESPCRKGGAKYPAINLMYAFEHLFSYDEEYPITSYECLVSQLVACVDTNSIASVDWCSLNVKEHIELFETLWLLWQQLGASCVFDCHDGNYMLSHDGTLIITDPVSTLI